MTGLRIGRFPLLWDDVLKARRLCVEDAHDVAELEALGLVTLKEELEKLGVKCGGTARERAERLWRTREVADMPRFLLLPENADLLPAVGKCVPCHARLAPHQLRARTRPAQALLGHSPRAPAGRGKRKMDVSVALVLEKQQRKARAMQGPLPEGRDRVPGQKSLGKAKPRE